uniref:Cathepsin propeptide inhibitor domain-containing protein n=1 Tax=Ananas comosus var. bracteatus TaxID=296719 RepID=A0A6V7PNV8_ANACO|nr:unnamed protein product [Ananas comosus var. bracteatus]
MSNFWQTLTEGFNGMLKAGRSMTTKMSMTNERNEEELRRMHEEWMVKYEQTYANAEEKERRFVLFKESVENCDRCKEQYEGCRFAPGWLADRTKEEWDAILPPMKPMDNRWEEGKIVTRRGGRMTVTRRDVSKPPNCGEGCYTGRDVVSET